MLDQDARPVRGYKRPLDLETSRLQVIAEAAKGTPICIDSDEELEHQPEPKRHCGDGNNIEHIPESVLKQGHVTSSTDTSQITGPIQESILAESYVSPISDAIPSRSKKYPLTAEEYRNFGLSLSSAISASYPSPETSTTSCGDEQDNSLSRASRHATISDGDTDNGNMHMAIKMAQMISESGEVRQPDTPSITGSLASNNSHPVFLCDEKESLRLEPKLHNSGSDKAESSGEVSRKFRSDSLTPSFSSFDEECLELARQYNGSKYRINRHVTTMTKPRLKKRRHRENPNDLHPASKEAAGRWRTQNRHTDHDLSQSKKFGGIELLSSAEPQQTLAERESRLKAFTGLRQQPVVPKTPPRHKSPMQNQSLITNSVIGTNAETASNSSSPRKRQSLNEKASSAKSSKNISSAQTGSILNRLALRHVQTIFEAEAIDSEKLEGQSHNRLPNPKVILCKYPKQGENLTLHKNFERFDQETQSIIREHEILKKRKLDLEAIDGAFEEIARLVCITELEERANQEMRTVHEFAENVLDQDLSGSKMRKRVQEIKFNFKSRVDRLGQTPNPEDVQKLRQQIIKPLHLQRLETELPGLDSRIEELGLLRSKATIKRGSSLIQKVRFSEERGKKEVTSNLKHLSKSQRGRLAYEKWENERKDKLQTALNKYKEAAVANEELLINDRELRASGDHQEEDKESTISEEQDGEEFMRPLGFVSSSTGELRIQDMETDLVEEHEARLRRAEQNATQPQKADVELEIRMKQKQHTQDIGIQSRDQLLLEEQTKRAETSLPTSEIGPGIGGDTSEIEAQSYGFDDEYDTDDDEEYVAPEERQIHRYVVKAVLRGVPDHVDDEEYEVGRFLSCQKASKRASQIIDAVFDHYIRSHEGHEAPECQRKVKLKDDLYEHRLETGPDNQIEARVWMEKDVQTISQSMYEKAKFRAACIAKSVYVVEWEKTVTQIPPEEEEEEDEQHNKTPDVVESTDTNQHRYPVEECGNEEDSGHTSGLVATSSGEIDAGKIASTESTSHTSTTQSDAHPPSSNSNSSNETARNYDDPFSPEPETEPELDSTRPLSAEPLKACKTSSAQNGTAELQVYSCASFANRAAKNLFFNWWKGHLLGRENHRHIREEEMYMERDLEMLGDQGCWKREEDFDYYCSEKGQTCRKMNERYKVWVSEVKVKGPGN